MSKFRFKDYIFKNLLPFYYQHNDTYKDDQGKGILERFMEIGSTYFDSLKIGDEKLIITGLPDNSSGKLGLIRALYKAYGGVPSDVVEFVERRIIGHFPFTITPGEPLVSSSTKAPTTENLAYQLGEESVPYKIESSYQYNSLPNLENFIDLVDVDRTPELFLNYLWEFLGEIPYGYGVIVQGKDPETAKLISSTDYLGINTRDLLRYAISLYRIRGTEKFYDILGKFYGVELVIIETKQGGDPGEEETIPVHDHLILATYTNDNNEESVATYGYGIEEIRAPYPDGTCNDCLYYLVRVKASYKKIMKWQEEGHTQVVKDIIASIVSKYLPVHCQLATYNSGEKKVIIEKLEEGDFNNTYSPDFYTAYNDKNTQL